MKGLLLSFIIFVFYVIITSLASHFLKLRRHSSFFLGFLGLAILIFVFLYYWMPSNLWVLPPSWQAHYASVDVVLGFIMLLLNVHSYVDWFFAFNGGFSTSLMLLLLDYEPQGAANHELISHYVTADGIDKIHAWRLPRLESTDYLKIDQETKICLLTQKGKWVAILSSMAKKLFNLGLGG